MTKHLTANTFTDLDAGARLALNGNGANSSITSNKFTDCIRGLTLENLSPRQLAVVYPQCNTFERTDAGNGNYYTSYGIWFTGAFAFDDYDKWSLPNGVGRNTIPLKNYFTNVHPYPSTMVWLYGQRDPQRVVRMPIYATYDGVTSDPGLIYSPTHAINPTTLINRFQDLISNSRGVNIVAGAGRVENSKYDDGQSCVGNDSGIHPQRPVGGTSSATTYELGQVHPNPVSEQAVISYRLPADLTGAALVVREVQSGQMVRRLLLVGGQAELLLDVTGLRAGVYTYQVEGCNVVLPARRLLVNH